MSWWQDVVTQAFGENGERGVDLGTPLHTLITSLYPGKVSEASCGHPWGCEVGVDVTVPGHGPLIEYFLHLDDLLVGKGQSVIADQPVGLSGGQLAGGDNPNSPSVSTGPHTEVGFFQGQFWGPSFDPLSIVRAGPQVGAGGPSAGDAAGAAAQLINLLTGGSLSNIAPGVTAAENAASGPLGNIGGGLATIGEAINNVPTAVGHGISGFLTTAKDNTTAWAFNQLPAIAVAAVVLLVLFGGREG